MLDLTDFALQEQTKDNLMVTISQAGYKGSYTMAAKPMKSLRLYNDPAFNNDRYMDLIRHATSLYFPYTTLNTDCVRPE